MVLSSNLWKTPVTLLTGFLGAGKTTLLNSILKGKSDRRFGILVNDFGSLNIDQMLIKNRDDDLITLEGGCVCCNLQNNLVNSLPKILSLRPDQILIEASGIANPYTLLQTLKRPVLSRIIRLESIITLVDATYLPQICEPSGKINYQDLLIDQISAADIVVLNKIDLIDEKAEINASQIIQKIAPWVRLLKGSYGDVSLDLLLGFRDSFPVHSVSSQLKSNHSDNFHTWSYESVRPFQLLTLGKILGKLPVTVWRAKGFLSTVEHPNRRVILQQVGPRITLEIGEEWGNNPPFTQLVLISTEAINTNILQQQLDSCLRVEDFEVNSKTQTKDNFILTNEM